MFNKSVYRYDEMKRGEHMAVRTTAGWYLFTHTLLEVTGEDVVAFLEYVFPNNIGNLKVGRERYTTMLDEKGEIIDDVVVFRKAEDKFWISNLFVRDMILWFNAHKGAYQVQYENITDKSHMYAIQGPKSLEIVNSLVDNPVDELKFFSFADNVIDGEPVWVNRAGFTGEKYGYEVYIAADKADWLDEKIRAAAEKVGGREVTEFQVIAWTLPTEAGYYYMRDLRHCNPFEVGLEKGINWDKDFIGKEALLKVKENGPAREMVGYILDEADVRIHARDLGGQGDKVTLAGKLVGYVDKINYSYILDKAVGYIIAFKGAVKPGDKVLIKGEYTATIAEKPFVK